MNKNIFLFAFLLVLGFLFVQCSNEDDKTDRTSVKVFVQQVKSGQYEQKSLDEDTHGLPAFAASDIPELLRYAEDNTPIDNFPLATFLSSYQEGGYYRMSQCLLWIVEKIRVGGYPSPAPLLYKKSDTGQMVEVTDPIEIGAVCRLYINWWKTVENESLESSFGYFNHNPLEGSNYSWSK